MNDKKREQSEEDCLVGEIKGEEQTTIMLALRRWGEGHFGINTDQGSVFHTVLGQKSGLKKPKKKGEK